MSGEVIGTPPEVHHCNPGWEEHWCDGIQQPGYEAPPPAGWYMHDLCLPVGTVWKCACGQVWVCEDVHAGFGWMSGHQWRRERWRERRRRLRTERET